MAESPPNLRFADSHRDCSNCTGYKPNSQVCGMFSDWPVSPELVCDAYDPIDPASVKDDDAEGS